LNWVNSSFLSPVNFDILNSGCLIELFGLEVSVVWKSSHHFLGLILSHGRENIVSNEESIGWIVVDLIVSSILLGEDFHSKGIFFLSTVRDTIVSNVFHESGFDSTLNVLS
jgi:hypothetical protein